MKTSSDLVTEMIGKWARDRYTNHPDWLTTAQLSAFQRAHHFTLEQETRNSGFCETCWDEYAAIILYAVDEEGGETELWETDSSLVDLMAEVIEANK